MICDKKIRIYSRGVLGKNCCVFLTFAQIEVSVYFTYVIYHSIKLLPGVADYFLYS